MKRLIGVFLAGVCAFAALAVSRPAAAQVVTTYYAPAVSQPYVANYPATTAYYSPAPVTTYYAPSTAPTTTYYAAVHRADDHVLRSVRRPGDDVLCSGGGPRHDLLRTGPHDNLLCAGDHGLLCAGAGENLLRTRPGDGLLCSGDGLHAGAGVCAGRADPQFLPLVLVPSAITPAFPLRSWPPERRDRPRAFRAARAARFARMAIAKSAALIAPACRSPMFRRESPPAFARSTAANPSP